MEIKGIKRKTKHIFIIYSSSLKLAGPNSNEVNIPIKC